MFSKKRELGGLGTFSTMHQKQNLVMVIHAVEMKRVNAWRNSRCLSSCLLPAHVLADVGNSRPFICPAFGPGFTAQEGVHQLFSGPSTLGILQRLRYSTCLPERSIQKTKPIS